MEKNIFKDKPNSGVTAEYFNQRAKILTPGVWVVVVAVIVILAGIVVFSFQGEIKKTVSVFAKVSNGQTCLVVPETYRNQVKVGQRVKYQGKNNEDMISKLSDDPIPVFDESFYDEYILESGNYSNCEYVYLCFANTDLEDGYYYAKIITDSKTPFEAMFQN